MASDPRLARARSAQAATPPPPPPPPTERMPETTSLGLDGTSDERPYSNGTTDEAGFKLKFCTVCASNNNRSVRNNESLLRGVLVQNRMT